MEILISLTSAVAAGLVMAASVIAFFWGRFDRLRDDVKKLETDRIARIEADLAKHLDLDRSQEVFATLRGINNSLKEIKGEITKLQDSTSNSLRHVHGKLDGLSRESESQDAMIQIHEKRLDKLEALKNSH